MRVLIYGAGAVGCYLGGHLANVGHHITLLGRQSFMEPIHKEGLTIQKANGEVEHVTNLAVATNLNSAINQGPYDWIAFTMKAYDTLDAINALKSSLVEPPPIVCFQNGIGNEESLRAAFGSEQIVSAALLTAVSISAPGSIVEEKQRGIALALDVPVSTLIAEAFYESGLTVGQVQDSSSLKWSKLLLNMLSNATSAILDMLPEAVMADPDLFAIEVLALREAVGIMQLLDIDVVDLPGAPARQLIRATRWLPSFVLRPVLQNRVARGRGEKPPSLLLALRSGHQETEVIWLNGAVAQAASSINRLAPINHAIALLVTDIARGRVSWDTYRQQPEMLIRAIRTAQGMAAL